MNAHSLLGEDSDFPTSSMPTPIIKRFTRKEISFCPTCAKKNKQNFLKSSQVNDDEYVLICTDRNCCFTESGIGIVPLDREELIAAGFPGELMLHMDVYEDDLEMITRLCIYMYVKKRSSRTTRNVDAILQNITNEIELMQYIHGLSPKDSNMSTSHLKRLPSCRKLRSLLKSFVSDIPSTYLERVFAAFSKIKNYKFPDSLIISIKNTHALNDASDNHAHDNASTLEGYSLPNNICEQHKVGKVKISDESNVDKVVISDQLKELIDSYVDIVPEIECEDELSKFTQELEKEVGIEELLEKYNLLDGP